MKINTSKRISFYTQGHQFAARVLCTFWLFASGSPEGVLAAPERQPDMVPATTTSPQGPSLASALPTLPPGGILQLPPDSPGSFWGSSVASTPVLECALQQRMSQRGVPHALHSQSLICSIVEQVRGRDLLRTSLKASPVGENLPFEARGGESVRFHYQQGQWRAEVSSRIGAFFRRAVLPVVCSSGEDVTSSLEVLSTYPSWQRQRQIHVLDRNVCPTLGEVVYVGELGLKGGGQGQSSGRGGKALSNPKKQRDGEPYRSKPPGPSLSQAPSTSPVASSSAQPATTTGTSIKTSSSVKGKEPCRPQLTTRASDLDPAHIDQLAEEKGPTPLELNQIEAKRLKEQIDQLYPKLSEATQGDYSQIVDELILHLVCLLELESWIGVQDSNSAQDYITRLWEVHATRRGGAAYRLVDKQLTALLERAYVQALKAANPNRRRTKRLASMLKSAKSLEQLAVSDQKQGDKTETYTITPMRSYRLKMR